MLLKGSGDLVSRVISKVTILIKYLKPYLQQRKPAGTSIRATVLRADKRVTRELMPKPKVASYTATRTCMETKEHRPHNLPTPALLGNP